MKHNNDIILINSIHKIPQCFRSSNPFHTPPKNIGGNKECSTKHENFLKVRLSCFVGHRVITSFCYNFTSKIHETKIINQK